MALKSELENATKNADEFYKVDDENLLVAHQYGEHCYKLVCFKTDCGCQNTQSCDLDEGETIKNIYPSAEEITKADFESMFTKCYKEYYQIAD